MHTLTQYIESLEHAQELCRTLKGLELEYLAPGIPRCHRGNSAIIFPIRLHGRRMRLRCYTLLPSRDLKRLYGEALREQELLLFAGNDAEWVDVVIEEWIEGKNLEEEVREALLAKDSRRLGELSRSFKAFVLNLLREPWAHGDLKPENILVDEAGELHLIDFDGCYLADESAERGYEAGTPAYRHPKRGLHHDRWIDHYPAALIAVQLQALALDPTLAERHQKSDEWLFLPEQLLGNDGRPLSEPCTAYEEVCRLFSTRGDAVHYRLARLLRYPDYRLPDVESLLAFSYPLRPLEEPTCYFERQLVGFTSRGEAATPLLYDEALEFKEGYAAVRLGPHWHYIDRRMRPVWHAQEGARLKNLDKGVARYRIKGINYSEPLF